METLSEQQRQRLMNETKFDLADLRRAVTSAETRLNPSSTREEAISAILESGIFEQVALIRTRLRALQGKPTYELRGAEISLLNILGDSAEQSSLNGLDTKILQGLIEEGAVNSGE